MLNQVGVWIDRRQAIVVQFSNAGEESIHINSGMESQERRASDHPEGAFEPMKVPADDTRDRKETAELGKFYDEVISHLRGAQSIYVCGPGEARKQLRNRIEETRSITGKVEVEAADSMTDAQFVAKVRKHFQLE
jgi:hypothetical protein